MDAESEPETPLTLSDIYGTESVLKPPKGATASATSAEDEDDASSLCEHAPPVGSLEPCTPILSLGNSDHLSHTEDGGTGGNVSVCIGDLILCAKEADLPTTSGSKKQVETSHYPSLGKEGHAAAPTPQGQTCCDGKCKPGECKCPESCKGCPQSTDEDEECKDDDEPTLAQQIEAFEKHLASLDISHPEDHSKAVQMKDEVMKASSVPIIINAIHTTYAELHSAASPELVNKMRLAMKEIPEVRAPPLVVFTMCKILNHKVQFQGWVSSVLILTYGPAPP
jgi:hypothetical protein